MKKYHLGCGTQYIDGYINVDFPQAEHTIASIKADIYADLLKIKLEPCEEIKNNHVFEHFNYMESLALLVKWVSALKPNGFIIIGIPDIEILSQELIKSTAINDIRRTFKIIRLMYGSHEAEWAYHINNWSIGSLTYAMEKFGMILVSSRRYGPANGLFPNCTLEVVFQKSQENSNLEDIAKDLLSFYCDLPAQQDLLAEFIKQFDKVMQG